MKDAQFYYQKAKEAFDAGFPKLFIAYQRKYIAKSRENLEVIEKQINKLEEDIQERFRNGEFN